MPTKKVNPNSGPKAGPAPPRQKRSQRKTPAQEPARTEFSRKTQGKRRAQLQLGMYPEMMHIKDGGANLNQYYRSLDDPVNHTGKLPYTNNVIQSPKTTTIRMTATVLDFSAALSSSKQFYLFPGHGAFTTFDDQANHHLLQVVNATNYCVGPMNTTLGGGHTAIAGIVTSVSAASSTGITNTASSTPIGWDTTAPFVHSQEQGHSRWALVSANIRLTHITPVLERGGSVVIFKPNQRISNVPTSQSQLKSLGSWTRLELSDKSPHQYEVNFVPLPEDMAFWHTYSTSTIATLSPVGGIYIWINAPANYAQSFNIDIVCNFELAGTSLVAVTTEKITTPASMNVMQPANEYSLLNNVGRRVGDVASSIAFGVAPRVLDAASTYMPSLPRSVAMGAASLLGDLN